MISLFSAFLVAIILSSLQEKESMLVEDTLGEIGEKLGSIASGMGGIRSSDLI